MSRPAGWAVVVGVVVLTSVAATDRELGQRPTGLDDLGPHRIIREFGLTATTRDGVALVADVYRPDIGGRVPAVLARTPYMRTAAGYARLGRYWASHGYGYVVQDVRGRGDSEGVFEPLVQEVDDGDDTLDWVARLSWSDGKVGTMGGSYLGWTQVLPARLNNPALRAMIPAVTPSDPGGFWPMRRGGLSFGMLEWALLVEGRTNRPHPYDDTDPLATYRSRPIVSIDERMGQRSRVWREYLRNLDRPEYWEPRSYQPRLPEARVPMLHITGWYDGTLGGSLENFAAMRARADIATRSRQHLLVGPWRHRIDADAQSTRIGEVDFGPASRVDTYGVYRDWFDHHLRDSAVGVARWPRVRLFQMGANRWIGGGEWPLEGTRLVRYYFDHDARGGILVAQGPAAGDGADHYTYDPDDPTPFLWAGDVDSGGPDDYRAVEGRDDVLTYTTRSPRTPMHVCGPVRATVFAASSARDTDWVVRLSLVHQNGYSQRLTEGWVRARSRRGNFRNDPLVPGRVERYDLDLWGTCLAVNPGQRLRVAVASASFPQLVPNLNTGGDLATETDPIVAHQTIHRAGTRASYLLLPVLDQVQPVEVP